VSVIDDYAVADQAVVVALAALYLAQVELTCGRVGCLPAHCRVRNSLSRSLDAERAELVRLQRDHQHQTTSGTPPPVVAGPAWSDDPVGTDYQVAS
jgi:hypothetical protein